MRQMLYYCHVDSPLGELTLISDGENLTGLELPEHRYQSDLRGADEKSAVFPVFKETADWLQRYFCGENCPLSIGMKLTGTPFQQRIWSMLMSIPYGETRTYGWLASDYVKHYEASGRSGRGYAQAVGNAVGHNPLPIIVPCHRIIGADGSLVGYGGGLKAKRMLLELEGVRQLNLW